MTTGLTLYVQGRGDANAASSRIRGCHRPWPASYTDTPVRRSTSTISVTPASGFSDLRTAHAPDTCGAAIDVPPSAVKPPPGTAELMISPGASSVSCALLLVNDDTASVPSSVVEP